MFSIAAIQLIFLWFKFSKVSLYFKNSKTEQVSFLKSDISFIIITIVINIITIILIIVNQE